MSEAIGTFVEFPVFSLTSEGERFVEKIILLKLTIKEKNLIKDLVENLNKLSLWDLLYKVYNEYPEFTINSIIKEGVLKTKKLI